LKVRPYIEAHAKTFGIDPNLVRALITQESRFRAEAISPTGAYGLGQFTKWGVLQVLEVAEMPDCPDPDGLEEFTRMDAGDPDLGVKAVCAYLWWLFNEKYPSSKVPDKRVQLEAVLTFYNSGGRAAYRVVKYGGHDNALPYIKKLPPAYRSQAEKYAPEVAMWYIAWHELLKPQTTPIRTALPSLDPFKKEVRGTSNARYRALIEALRLLGEEDEEVDVIIDTREGLTEVTFIVPGEFIIDGGR
jgi:hypothetical protein